jgi:hypothetical protein
MTVYVEERFMGGRSKERELLRCCERVRFGCDRPCGGELDIAGIQHA